MGSVISDIECPNCKKEAFEDFYYKSGEEYIFCNHCGYHKSATIIDRKKSLAELTDSDWRLTEIKNPFGAFKIKNLGAISTTCGTLATEKEFEELKESIKPVSQNVETFTISRLIGNDIVEIDVLNEIKNKL